MQLIPSTIKINQMNSNKSTISQYLTKKEIANKADSIAIKIIESGKGTLQFANKTCCGRVFHKRT